MTDDRRALHRWRQRFTLLCGFLAAVSASWMVLGTLDPFGLYDRLLAHALFDAPSLGPLATPVFRFAAGLLGATSAAFFLLLAYVAEHGLPARWAYRALWGSLLTWFVLGAGLSLYAGVWVHVLFVQLPGLVALGLPLLALRRQVEAATNAPDASPA